MSFWTLILWRPAGLARYGLPLALVAARLQAPRRLVRSLRGGAANAWHPRVVLQVIPRLQN